MLGEGEPRIAVAVAQPAEATADRGTPSDTAVRIRAAATWLFANQGYAATGIRDIARLAGITTSTLYHYTPSKERLLVDMMRDGQSMLNEATRQDLAAAEDPIARLSVLVSGLVAAHAVNPLTTRVIDNEIRALRPGSAERTLIVGLRDEYEAMWSETLERGVADGSYRIPDLRLTRLALLTMCTGLTAWYRPDGASSLEHLCQSFVEIALTTVGAAPEVRRTHADASPGRLATAALSPWEPSPDGTPRPPAA